MPRLRTPLAVAALAAFALLGAGMFDFFSSTKKDLARLLTPIEAPWLDSAEVVGWAPNPDLKPIQYYATAAMDGAAWQAWRSAAGLAPVAPGASFAAAWTLPEGVRIEGWCAGPVPDAAEAQGRSEHANLWVRFSEGRICLVAFRRD